MLDREHIKGVISDYGFQSVPPVWEAVQVLWEWMDAELVDEDNFDNAVPIGERRAWWEDMVAYLLDKVGWVSLT